MRATKRAATSAAAAKFRGLPGSTPATLNTTRVQAPMIDSLMREVGIEGGTIGRMTDVLRDAKDIDQLTRGRANAKAPAANGNGREDLKRSDRED